MKKQYQSDIFHLNTVFSFCLFCILFFAFAGGGTDAGAEIIDRIVAQVNTEIVTLYDVNRALEPHLEKIKSMGYPPERQHQMLFNARQTVLNDLINDKLSDQEVKRAGIMVNESEIDSSVERVKEMNFLTEEDLVAALAQEGMTLKRYRENLKRQMSRSKLMNREIKSKIVITDVDIKKYYDAHSDEYAGKKAYHLRSIIKRIPAIADEDRIKSIVGRMKTIIEQLDKGASFEDLAREHSDLLADQGGELGVFELSSLSPEIRDAVSGLSEGKHSQIVFTQQGYQIVYVEEIVATPGTPIESVTEEIKDALYKEMMDKKFAQWVGSLKADAHIKIMK
jgi:peptidyl-prolyl cis-trans isomerase SurA